MFAFSKKKILEGFKLKFSSSRRSYYRFGLKRYLTLFHKVFPPILLKKKKKLFNLNLKNKSFISYFYLTLLIFLQASLLYLIIKERITVYQKKKKERITKI